MSFIVRHTMHFLKETFLNLFFPRIFYSPAIAEREASTQVVIEGKSRGRYTLCKKLEHYRMLSRILLMCALVVGCCGCYKMPTEDDYSVVPTINNKDVTRERVKVQLRRWVTKDHDSP